VITPHFIKRYRERGLGLEDCPPEKVLSLFLLQNAMRVIVYRDPKNPKVRVFASHQGLIITINEEEGINRLKTYIDDEMLYKTQRMAKEKMMEKMPEYIDEDNYMHYNSIMTELMPVVQEIYASYQAGAADYLVFRKTNTEEDVKLNFRLKASEDRMQQNKIKEKEKPIIPLSMPTDMMTNGGKMRFAYLSNMNRCSVELTGDENGKGTIYFKDDGVVGVTYVGMLKDGKPHGKGVMTTKEGSKFEGDFVNGEPNGHIKHTYKNSLDYDEGIFKGFQRNGYCHRHVGPFDTWATYVEDKRVGDMILKTSRYTYEGEFKNDNFNGRGIIRYNDGFAQEGVMKKGVLIGKGKEYRTDGSVVEAIFKKGLAQGKGTQTLPDGTILRGVFEDGELDGPVEKTNPDGTIVTVDFMWGEEYDDEWDDVFEDEFENED